MNICNFIRISNNIIKCQNCDTILEIQDDLEDTPVFPCFGSIADPFKATSIDAQKIKSSASELKPGGIDEPDMCSEDEILARYSICGKCEFFDNNTCSKCGCLLSRNKVYMSKLAWKNESCPVGFWSNISD
jgi:hypothetical protein